MLQVRWPILIWLYLSLSACGSSGNPAPAVPDEGSLDIEETVSEPDISSPEPDINSPELDVNSPELDVNSPELDVNSPEPDINSPETLSFETLVAADKSVLSVQSIRRLFADGEGVGLTAYELIHELGGSNNIESPDLYAINHPGVPHIYEALDTEVGEHFVFVIHRDEDRDRDRMDITDRQRNEIKTYSSSEDAVLGFRGETMMFSWKFRINDSMEVSRNFSHFFQLKAVGGSDSQPVLTITGNESSGQDGMEIRHSALIDTNRLGRIDWSEVTGEWLQVYCRARFEDDGELRLIISRMSDAEILFDITETNIDLWRGETEEHFVRPKWGIYRSLLDADNLRADEEDVRFADFIIEKATIN